MEKDSATFARGVDVDIVQLEERDRAARLWLLLSEKVMDLFLRDCEKLLQEGADLNALSALGPYKTDFRIEYESMKRMFAIATADLNIAKGSDEGWKEIKIDEKCTLLVKSHDTVLQLKIRGTVDLNIKHICYAAYLVKHYTECFPFCKQAKDILEPSRLEKIGFIRLSIPIPFIKDRSTLIRGVGFRHSQKPENVYIFAEGIVNEAAYLERMKISTKEYMKGRELLDIKHFLIQVKCLGPTDIEFCGAATVDHHISFIPEKLVMFVAREMGKFILNNLFNKLRKFETSIWAKELKQNYNENRQFCEWIDGIVDELLSSTGGEKK